MDDDVLTDEEQLELSYNHIISELEEGLSTFQRRKEKLKFWINRLLSFVNIRIKFFNYFNKIVFIC